MADAQQIELVFEPQDEGGYHVYAPDLPGLHTQSDDIDDAMANATNASEAVALCVESLSEDGEPLDSGMIRHSIPLPARARATRSSPASARSRGLAGRAGKPSVIAAAEERRDHRRPPLENRERQGQPDLGTMEVIAGALGMSMADLAGRAKRP